jgi:uroporphyrinogen decarboxylase
MTPRELVLQQIHHRPTVPVPYTLAFEDDQVPRRLDDHYGGPQWRKRLTSCMVVCPVVDTVRARRISDTHTEDAYGVRWRHGRTMVHLEPTFTEHSFDNYRFPGPEVFLDDAKKESARRELLAHPDRFRVVNIGWGLFEQSWRIRGFEQALVDAVSQPDFYAELLLRLTDLYLAFLEYSGDLPADAVMFGDDWGDQRGVILGPQRWRKFIKPCWQRLYAAAHAQGRIVMSHCCGSVEEIMPDIIEIGLDVLESVQPEPAGMNPYGLKRRWGDKITFWGGLGSQSLIPFGRPDQIRSEVKRLCRQMGEGGGYILAPAKPLQPDTPTENAVAVLEAFTDQQGSG